MENFAGEKIREIIKIYLKYWVGVQQGRSYSYFDKTNKNLVILVSSLWTKCSIKKTYRQTFALT